MRPVFCAFWPPPLNELTVATFGSARMISATRLCSRTIAGNEMSSDASVVTVIWPMSSCGKKPFGMSTNSHAVATTVSSATKPTAQRWRSAASRLRV
jgi:hypothetical protein